MYWLNKMKVPKIVYMAVLMECEPHIDPSLTVLDWLSKLPNEHNGIQTHGFDRIAVGMSPFTEEDTQPMLLQSKWWREYKDASFN